jgi:ankyrin repeat protein
LESGIRGTEKVVQVLHDTGKVGPEYEDNNGQTPLWEPVSQGHVKAMKPLLDTAKVNPERKDKHGQTPLFQAASRGQMKVVQTLLYLTQALREISGP